MKNSSDYYKFLNASGVAGLCVSARQLLCESKARQHCFIAMTLTPPSLLWFAEARRPRQGCQTTKHWSAKANILRLLAVQSEPNRI